MNWLDIVLASILLGSTVGGFVKGFFRLGIGLAATFLAFLLASWFYAEAGDWAVPYTSSKGVAHFVGYVIIFLGVMIAGALLGRFLARVFKWMGLSWLDRLGGGVLGILRGGLISLVIVLMMTAFLPGDPPAAVFHSRLAPYVLDGAHLLSLTTSPEMKQQFRQTYEKTKKAWVDPVRQKLEKLEQ
ncbi:MAG: CvpA family protein [Acidobacteria bacterium]|nr:CvpA family protein [Acidobacteriota bacterium]